MSTYNRVRALIVTVCAVPLVIYFVGIVQAWSKDTRTSQQIQDNYKQEQQRQEAMRLHQWGDSLAQSIVYIKDNKTGLCYAVLETAGGPPVITLVPEDKVEPFLVNK